MRLRFAALVVALLTAAPAFTQPPAAAVVPTKRAIRDAIPVPVPAAPVQAPDPQTLTAGKFRLLKVPDYTGPVTWKVTPAELVVEQDVDGTAPVPADSTAAVVFAKFRKIAVPTDPAVPKRDFRVCATLEGEAGERWHKVPLDAGDALYVRARPNGAGQITISAWGVVGGEAVELAALDLTVGGGGPPVEPTTRLTPAQTLLRTAIRTKDKAPPASVSKYAAVWKGAAKKTVHDKGIKTGDALLKEMNTAVGGLGLPHGCLDATAEVVANRVDAVLPKNPDAAIDDAVRTALEVEFLAIAKDLEAAK